jgi:hypothetical protein
LSVNERHQRNLNDRNNESQRQNNCGLTPVKSKQAA